MKKYYVSFSSAAEVHDFVSIATRQLFPVQVERNNQCSDAKSIMSIFSMGLNRPMRLVLPDAAVDATDFLSAVAPYLTV